jgi:hypothetical protein
MINVFPATLDGFRRFRRPVWSRFFCRRGIAGERRARFWRVATQPFTSLRRGISPILPITSLLRIPARRLCRNKNGPDATSLSQ